MSSETLGRSRFRRFCIIIIKGHLFLSPSQLPHSKIDEGEEKKRGPPDDTSSSAFSGSLASSNPGGGTMTTVQTNQIASLACIIYNLSHLFRLQNEGDEKVCNNVQHAFETQPFSITHLILSMRGILFGEWATMILLSFLSFHL